MLRRQFQGGHSWPSSSSVTPDPDFDPLVFFSNGTFTSLCTLSGWSPQVAAADNVGHRDASMAVGLQMRVADEATVDPFLFETSQDQDAREHVLFPLLSMAAVPAQHDTRAPLCSVSPPSMSNRFQKEQLALYRLFDSKQRLEEAVHAATRPSSSTCTDKKKKQGNRRGIYKCQFCDYTSNRSYNTKQHEKTHNDPPHRPHKCIICKKGFVRKYDLKIHHQMHIREIRDMMKSCGLVPE
ncbi:hypothetical protein BC940DRAFT_291828 [Gongronella butleri]|nr:hypothetical protein BC940DRAFT_291828 [Gongronella butleri]